MLLKCLSPLFLQGISLGSDCFLSIVMFPHLFCFSGLVCLEPFIMGIYCDAESTEGSACGSFWCKKRPETSAFAVKVGSVKIYIPLAKTNPNLRSKLSSEYLRYH